MSKHEQKKKNIQCMTRVLLGYPIPYLVCFKNETITFFGGKEKKVQQKNVYKQ
jgi:hypothetical protein